MQHWRNWLLLTTVWQHSTHKFLSMVQPPPPKAWTNSNIILIHKKCDTNLPNNFRMIALGSRCAKLFHQLLAPRLVTHLTRNGYIDKIIQKAFISKINGTIEHTQFLSEIIWYSKANRHTLHTTLFLFRRCIWQCLTWITYDWFWMSWYPWGNSTLYQTAI